MFSYFSFSNLHHHQNAQTPASNNQNLLFICQWITSQLFNKPQKPKYVHREFDQINPLIKKNEITSLEKKNRGTKFSYLKVKCLISL